MTRKFQSGQEKLTKNRNCVYLASAPPRLGQSHVGVGVDLGQGGTGGFPCRVEGVILTTLTSVSQHLYIILAHHCVKMSLVFLFLKGPSYLYMFNLNFVSCKEILRFRVLLNYTLKIYQFIILRFLSLLYDSLKI